MSCFGNQKEGSSNSTSSLQPVSLLDPPTAAADGNDQPGDNQNPSGVAFKEIEFGVNPPSPSRAALAVAVAAAAAANRGGQQRAEQNRDAVGDDVVIRIDDPTAAAADAAGDAVNGQPDQFRRTWTYKLFDKCNAPALAFYSKILPEDEEAARKFDPMLLNNFIFNAFFGLFDRLFSDVRGPSALPAMRPPERLLVPPTRLRPPPEELTMQPTEAVHQQMAAAAAAKTVDRPPMKPFLRRVSVELQGQQLNFYARMMSKKEFEAKSWWTRNISMVFFRCCYKEASEDIMRMSELQESERALEEGLQQAGGVVAKSDGDSVSLHVPVDDNNAELPGPSAAAPPPSMDDGSINEQQPGAPRARGVSLVDNVFEDQCGL